MAGLLDKLFKGPSPVRRPIALLTDFGLDDPYVGQMKGVMARLASEIRILDLSHGVEPFNLVQAGFILKASAKHFPKNTVFVSVVDPGVGTSRRIILVEINGQSFLAPDNGLLGLVLARVEQLEVFDMSRAVTALDSVSATFHGRDVFAPLASWLALGGPVHELGTRMEPEDLAPSAFPEIIAIHSLQKHEETRVTVLHADRFGNCVLGLESGPSPLPDFRALRANGKPAKIVTTYGELAPGELGLLAGSQDYMELAVNQGSAALELGLSPGDEAILSPEG